MPISASNDSAHGQRVDSAVKLLAEEIVSGKIKAGERLIETALAKRLGISRGPVREALRRLEERGLVKSSPNVGAHVASFSIREMAALFEVREAMEGMACRLAAQRMDDRDLARLRAVVDEHEVSIREHPDGAYLQEPRDLDFHFRIVNNSGNPVLIRLLCDELYQVIRLCRRQHSWLPGRGLRALKEHRRIIEALEDRDHELAEWLMRRHIATARQVLEARLGESEGMDESDGAGEEQV